MGRAKEAEAPLNFFRHLFWSMVPDTETHSLVLALMAIKAMQSTATLCPINLRYTDLST